MIFSIPLLLVFAATLRLLQLLRNIYNARTRQQSAFAAARCMRTLVVLGSGGHTTEMLSLIDSLEATKYSPMLYCKASSDTTSLQRLQQSKTYMNQVKTTASSISVYDVPRAREVGQSYLTSVWTTLHAQLCAFQLVHRIQPRLIICNGPGTCLPICLAAVTLRYLGLLSVEIVFCESLCRVESLSMTGKVLYRFVDVFLVHWPELQLKYAKSRRVKVFVP
ncbi:hypothetical protein MPSEU_000169000 [Mayamaea pseudoterrestris]|nr:hypothetical protein MPSEU_000169000 [Mayamaea pseudoterrestris]